MMHYSQIVQKSSNLVKNSGFEKGLNFWDVNNVTVGADRPFEGMASARLGTGEASLSQDIMFEECKPSTFLFGFSIQAPLSFDPGDITVEILWIRDKCKDIETGLKIFVPSVTTGEQLFWLSYVDVTNCVPKKTCKARIVFRKESGTASPNDIIEIDNVLFTRIGRCKDFSED